MKDKSKTKEELVKELQEVRKELDSLRASMGKDITGSNPEEKLRESKHIIEGIINTIPAGVFWKDKNLNYLGCNLVTAIDAGFSDPKDVIGKNDFQMGWRDRAESYRIDDLQVIESESSKVNIEEFLTNASGETVIILTTKIPLKNSVGEVTGVLGTYIDITERKHFEEKVLKSEARYRNIINISPVPMALNDERQNITLLNPAFIRTFGYSPEDIPTLSNWWPKAYPDLDYREVVADKWQTELQKSKQTGATFTPMELKVRCKNGTDKIVMATASSISNAYEGDHLVILYDITERKQAEEKIMKSEAQLANALDIAKLGPWEYDVATDTFTFNDHFYNVFRTTVEREGGYTMTSAQYARRFVHADDMPLVGIETRKAIESTDPNFSRDLEHRIFYADGELGYINVHFFIIKDAQGRTVKTYGVNQDVTERKRMEDKIREKDIQFRKLSSNLPDLIYQFTKRPDGTYCVPIASEGIRNIFGCSPEDVVDDFAPIGRVIFHEDAERVINDIEYSAKHLTYFTCEFRVQIPGKPIQWIFSRSTPEKLADGSIAWYGFNADITGMKQKEEEILYLNSTLDLRVKQRTSELEAVTKELETFSYSVSHDLKTPLRHIRSFIGLFLENKSKELSEEDLGYLDIISSAASDMERLIDGILAFSKLNGIELRKSRIRSSEMVQQVIKFFDPEIQNRKITFQVETLPEVKGDEDLIRQVWINLISNAIKYTMKKPEAVIEIGSSSTENEITFYIKDNGAGFNVKYVKKLFGVFQRLHKSSDFDGVGIGLANVNRILTRHGGHCRAEGEVDQGATFYFSLPK